MKIRFLASTFAALSFTFSAIAATPTPRTACRYFRDAEDIPHFTVHTKREAFGCLGYFHGLDRAWQSDYLRRTALGTRAEIEGVSALKDDLTMRLFGFGELADRIVAGLDANTLDALKAYAEGWNRGTEQAVRAGTIYELKDWKQNFNPWTPRDTVVLLLLQSFDQTRRSFEMRFTQAGLAARYGERAAELNSETGLPWATTVIKADEVPVAARAAKKKSAMVAKLPASVDADPAPLREFFAFHALDFLGDSSNKGSNNWVVAPDRMNGGNAVLMNDPHLALTTPSFWYMVEMHVDGEGSTFGATLPGGPLVTSGVNEKVSWGLTNSFFDVSDVAYVSPDLVPDLVKFKPKVYVNVLGAKIPVSIKTFSRTKDGYPVLPVDGPKGKVALLKWTGFRLEGKDFAAVLDVPFMKSVPDADQVFSRIGFPSWNFVFADVDGRIGHRVIGKLPRMTSAHFGVPVLDKAADVAAFREWSYLTEQEAPHVTNPARGFIASANEQSWPASSPLSAGRAQVPSFRAFRIEEVIGAKPKHSLEDLRQLQCDVEVIDARFLRPLLVSFLDGSFRANAFTSGSYEGRAAEALRKWNGVADVDCTGCTVYRFWMNRLMKEFGGGETEVFRLFGNPVRYGVSNVSFRSSVAKAWSEAIGDLRGVNPKAIPAWREMHVAPFRHLSNRAAWNPVNPLVTPGDGNSVNPGSFDAARPGEHRAGASMRTQIEMSRPPKVWAQLTGAQLDRANPDLSAAGSPWSKWRDCRIEAREFPASFSSRPLATVQF